VLDDSISKIIFRKIPLTKDGTMEKETIDLRSLLLMIEEKKKMDANLALEYDCIIEADDITPLVKVINYAINYIDNVAENQQQISLNCSMSGITMGFTAFTEQPELPPLNDQVSMALEPYNAILEQKGESGKYAQLLITFANN